MNLDYFYNHVRQDIWNFVTKIIKNDFDLDTWTKGPLLVFKMFFFPLDVQLCWGWVSFKISEMPSI